MATPAPKRGATQNTARAVNRIAPGLGGGKRAGLGPVVRTTAAVAVPPTVGITVWEQADEPMAAAIHDFWWDTDETL